MLNKQVFENLLLELEVHFRKKLSPFVRDIYFEKMMSFSEEQFKNAVEGAIIKFSAGNSFFPSAQQLYDFAYDFAVTSILNLDIEPSDRLDN